MPKRRCIHWAAALVMLVVCGGRGEPVALESLFDEEGAFWKQDEEAFMAANGLHGFRWASEAHDTARAYRAPHVFLELAVVETLVRWEQGVPREVDIFLYNRGDIGVITEELFRKMIQSADESLDAWAGSPGRAVLGGRRTSGVKSARKVWTWRACQVALEYSYSTGAKAGDAGFLPEFIRVRCVPAGGERNLGSNLLMRRAQRDNARSMADLKANVVRDANGDVRIEGIPMVNQGEKGYCAVATAERVLRYYGRDIDNAELAQLAMSSARQGTNPDVMLDALRHAGLKLGCKVKEIESVSVRGLKELVDKYNTEVRRAGLPRIELGRMIVVSELYERMDLDALRKARLAQSSDHKRFHRKIREYVDEGLPLCWSLFCGKIPEEPALRGVGGHMRLIIGYNDKTDELIYSDSWGAGHECKRMGAADAWAVTTGLYAVEPGRMH